MAPVQPGASVVATGLGIRYIGEFVYAYSGTYQASTTPQTIIDTVSGSGVIVGEFQFNQPVNPNDPADDETSAATIKFNGETVAIIRARPKDVVTQKVVIPPFTVITITADSSDNVASRLLTLTFVGRVYGQE